MFLKKHNRTGKVLASIGVWVFSAGFAFSELFGISDMPDMLRDLSIPLIVLGILLVITSNFFKKREF